ncbi:hypothetical protein FNF29_04600 [Cafeteria roenbergensis]|uniref:G-protein coupled receptors family 3 profile domain-containing protein n=1 Tax=Cafeteria roenbergensis TaxID=33653 RepID=A0A5A8CHT0_CAFRO|nr:hypothetical protein FNF29_04600 [Cafeteria roenbergensis]|eukprot:KAA0151401.1 hypothetical protein FNF29_04600 [Cafeteria roenbergensis]
MTWHPFLALGLGPAVAPEALALCQADDSALASLRRQVTIAYHHLSRKCRGRDVHAWLRSKALPHSMQKDVMDAIQAARSLVDDRVALARYTAAVLDSDGGADAHCSLALETIERVRAAGEQEHTAESYMVILGNELHEEASGGAGLVIERAVFGDLGFHLESPQERAKALAAAMWLEPASAFEPVGGDPGSSASRAAKAVLESRLQSGRAIDVTIPVQTAAGVSWDETHGCRVVSLRMPAGPKSRLPGFFDPCAHLDESSPTRAIAIRYRFGGAVHVVVAPECSAIRLPLRSHAADTLLHRWPRPLANLAPRVAPRPAVRTSVRSVLPASKPAARFSGPLGDAATKQNRHTDSPVNKKRAAKLGARSALSSQRVRSERPLLRSTPAVPRTSQLAVASVHRGARVLTAACDADTQVVVRREPVPPGMPGLGATGAMVVAWLAFQGALGAITLPDGQKLALEKQLDAGFALQILGTSWAVSKQPVLVQSSTGISIQVYMRPLGVGGLKTAHFVQLVENPIEMARPSIARNASVVGSLRPSKGERFLLDLYTAAGQLMLDLGNTTVALQHVSSNPLQAMIVWRLLTLSLNSVTGKVDVFLNSVYMAQATIEGADLLHIRERLQQGLTGHVGLGKPRWNAPYIGEFDDFRLLSSPMTWDDVRFVFQQRNLPPSLAPYALVEWRFDELLLSHIHDSSLNGGASGVVIIGSVSFNIDGTQLVTMSEAGDVRFDGYSVAKVPSEAGYDAQWAGCPNGAISPAIARRHGDSEDTSSALQNVSTAISIVHDTVGLPEPIRFRLVPRQHNLTVATLPSCGELKVRLADDTTVQLKVGDVVASDPVGVLRLEFTANASFATAPHRAAFATFHNATLPDETQVRLGEIGYFFQWLEQVQLVILINESPKAASFRAQVREDQPAAVFLGAFGEVSAGGIHFQADSEGQRLVANVTSLPERGRLFQKYNASEPDFALALSSQLLPEDLPVQLSGEQNQLYYMPPLDVSGLGVDTMNFVLTDSLGAGSGTGEITFDIESAHDPPVPGNCEAATDGLPVHRSNITGLTDSEQTLELQWLIRSCASMCTPEVVSVAEDGTVDFKLSIHSTEDSLLMVDIVAAPFQGELYQLMTSAENQDLKAVPARKVDLSVARSAELTLWARSVVDVSSRRVGQGTAWGEEQILGPPDVFPTAGNNELAWSPQGHNIMEWIELEFGERLFVTRMLVYETWFPGYIREVKFRHPDGSWLAATYPDAPVPPEGSQTVPIVVPLYWLRYVPSSNFFGRDSLVFATNDCDWDRAYRGTTLPCQEMSLEVIPTEDPPKLLNPWALDPHQAAVGLLGSSATLNASILVVAGGAGTGQTASGSEVSWAQTVTVETEECVKYTHASVLSDVLAGMRQTLGGQAIATLQASLERCGGSFLLRSYDPDSDVQGTTFEVFGGTANGVAVGPTPVDSAATLTLQVDTTRYIEALQGIDDVEAACSILDATATGGTGNDWGDIESWSTTPDSRRLASIPTGLTLTSTGLGAAGARDPGKTPTTLAELQEAASIVSYFSFDGQCGSNVDTLFLRALNNASTEGEAPTSAVLRAVVNVKCVPGTRRVSHAGTITMFTVSAIAVLVTASGAVGFIACWCRGAPMITKAQPWVTILTVVGSAGLIVSALLEMLPASVGMCDLRRALYALSFCFAYGPPAVKVFRVFRLLIKIHLNSSLERVAFGERSLLFILLVLGAGELLFVIIWRFASQTAVAYVPDPFEPMITHTNCSGPNESVLFGLWALFHVAVVGFTVYLAAITRNVHYQYGESRWVGYTIYAQSICTVAGLVASTSLGSLPQTQTLVTCLIVFASAMAAPVLMLHRRVALIMGWCQYTRTFDMSTGNVRASSMSSSGSGETGAAVTTAEGAGVSRGSSRRKKTRTNASASRRRSQGRSSQGSEVTEVVDETTVLGSPDGGAATKKSWFSFRGACATQSLDAKQTEGDDGSEHERPLPRRESDMLKFGSAKNFMAMFKEDSGTPTNRDRGSSTRIGSIGTREERSAQSSASGGYTRPSTRKVVPLSASADAAGEPIEQPSTTVRAQGSRGEGTTGLEQRADASGHDHKRVPGKSSLRR